MVKLFLYTTTSIYKILTQEIEDYRDKIDFKGPLIIIKSSKYIVYTSKFRT